MLVVLMLTLTYHEPAWLDRKLFPFRANYLNLPAGRMHYVDEGRGKPLVMLHGNPDWSFSFRKLILNLRDDYRCIAPDHIGFGLSQKPEKWSYQPEDHAENLGRLMEHLDLRDVTLVLNDWGGPIGLQWALQNLERVHSLVLMNTWMWPVADHPRFKLVGELMGSPAGRFFAGQLNGYARLMLPLVMGRTEALTPEVLRHYTRHQPTAESRKGTLKLASAFIDSDEWLTQLWAQRELLQDLPTLLCWGMKDPAFGPEFLKQWTQLLSNHTVRTLPEAGHIPQEEASEEVCTAMRSWLK